MQECAEAVAEPHVNDLDHLLAVRNGDGEAGRALMTRFGPSMVRTAWRVLGRYRDADAEDVVQEAFVAALTTDALPTGNVGAWLRSITVRKALDALRKDRRRGEESFLEERHPDESPGEDVIAVRQALTRVSAMDRAVLTLVDLEGRPMAEAAEILGVTRVAVRWRAVRARRRLARILEAGR